MMLGYLLSILKIKIYTVRWDEKNVNGQCAGCNTFRGGEQYRQSIGIDRKWGQGTSAELEQRAHTVVKLNRTDYEEAIANINCLW